MDYKIVFASLETIQEHGQALRPVVSSFTAVFHHYDFDAQTPGNGYRTLVKRSSTTIELRPAVRAAGRGPEQQVVQDYSSSIKPASTDAASAFSSHRLSDRSSRPLSLAWFPYGETFGKQQSGLGLAALSLLTSGKYVMDPELRGAEFERITQNLNMQFWKSFWNLTESGFFDRLQQNSFQPATRGPGRSTCASSPSELRVGQESEELLSYCRDDPPPITASQLPWVQKQPRSPWLLIHFHGGALWPRLPDPMRIISGFAPFPRALEECFYAYCWALNNCHLLGSTAERVCLAGDSAGGNLCITVSMKAISCGIRVPDGIMAAYPATLLTTDASPSRLLTLIDPLLPLGVLTKCINAYAGTDSPTVQPAVESSSLSALGRDTAVLLGDLTQGASNWIQSFLDPTRTTGGARSLSSSQRSYQSDESGRTPSLTSTPHCGSDSDYPEGFKPLRSECLAFVNPTSCPIIRNPFVSPLLSPDELLRGLPPVHIVASALDALLDDSVMFAKKLRDMGQPVSLTVVEDLPHGFLSLSQLSKETEGAAEMCVEQMRAIFQQEDRRPALRKRPTLEETYQSSSPSAVMSGTL
ncbi:hypothetical protein KUCAC02_011007 [Chaenocephalus aceratus]|uniref:Uncharacterized protein n=1 Tax=Chaenocephalus aceratus TaxID=36190 RepID=A0ACB9WUJ8_CHAAC|nr:hypothetical protein KUCAC02_011007 [Chaenocephalus aceratus]